MTAPELRGRKVRQGASAVSMVTAYDFTMARLVDEAGVDAVLVGDSLGMVVQGLPNTLTVTLDDVCYHGRAVSRGLERAHLVGDLPFMSYQVSPAQAVESAGKMIQLGAFESVKLEGGDEVAEHVRRIVRAGIPVMGHVGLTPQSVHAFGGFSGSSRALARWRMRAPMRSSSRRFPQMWRHASRRSSTSRRLGSGRGTSATGKSSFVPICSEWDAELHRDSPSASPTSPTLP
jgi:hypothetical protein